MDSGVHVNKPGVVTLAAAAVGKVGTAGHAVCSWNCFRFRERRDIWKQASAAMKRQVRKHASVSLCPPHTRQQGSAHERRLSLDWETCRNVW